MAKIITISLFYFCLFVFECSAINKDFNYTAAVVLFHPVLEQSQPSTYIQKTLRDFEPLVSQAASGGADIVVFPEGVLWLPARTREEMNEYCEVVPKVVNGVPKIIPCEDPMFDDRPILQHISCSARKHSLHVVVNMASKEECKASTTHNCPTNGYWQYNTDVAISAEGAILSYYHKHHEFAMIPLFDQAPLQLSYFDTSFGVRFGLFICFDLEWGDPARDLDVLGVKNIAFSTLWTNTPPQMTATMIQQGWSRTFGSNILASNINMDSLHGGGGVFSAGEALTSFFNATETPHASHVLIASVPANPKKYVEPEDAVKASLYSNVNEHPAVVVNCGTMFSPAPLCALASVASHVKTSLSLSQAGFHCKASFTPSINTTHTESIHYALLVHSGSYQFPGTPDTLYLSVCSIVHCPQSNTSSSSCLPDFSASLNLEDFYVEAWFDTDDIPLFFPLVATGPNGAPTNAASFAFTSYSKDDLASGNQTYHMITASTPQWDRNLPVFAAGAGVNRRPTK